MDTCRKLEAAQTAMQHIVSFGLFLRLLNGGKFDYEGRNQQGKQVRTGPSSQPTQDPILPGRDKFSGIIKDYTDTNTDFAMQLCKRL